MAHGSLYMLGAYIAYTCASKLGGVLGFWGGLLAAAAAVALVGVLIETLLLRRIYHVAELFQLLATFALVLLVSDVVAALWGVEDLLAPRAPGLRGSVEILGHNYPQYDLFLLVVGPLALVGLHALLTRTRWGTLVRAADALGPAFVATSAGSCRTVRTPSGTRRPGWKTLSICSWRPKSRYQASRSSSMCERCMCVPLRK